MIRPPPPPRPPKPPRPPRPALAQTTIGRSPFQDTEAQTGKTNQVLTLYQVLLSHYDKLSDGDRTDLVELVAAFGDMLPQERRRLLRVCRALAEP